MRVTSSSREPLSLVDTAWLHMEDPANLMMVTGLLLFDEPLDFERVLERVESAVRDVPRLTQRVVGPRLLFGPPHWEEDPLFDLAFHLHRVALPPPGGKRALDLFVSDLMSTPLELRRPLWQLHVVDGCGKNGKGSALLFRVHHAVGDGYALVSLLLSFVDGAPSTAAPAPPFEPVATGPLSTLRALPEAALAPALDAMRRVLLPGAKSETPLHPTLASLLSPLGDTLARASREARTTVRGAADFLASPTRILDAAWNAGRGFDALAHLLLMSPDPRTPLKGALGTRKRGLASRPFPLATVKSIGRAFGGTVNDVLVAAAAGGLRRYLLSRGPVAEEQEIRAVVPVNLRPTSDSHPVGNRFGLVFLPLPVGLADPVDRFFRIRDGMEDLKGSPEALVAFGLLGAVGVVPAEVEQGIVGLFGTRGTAVLTNVPGPKKPLFFAGRRVKEMMFWVPQSGRLGLGLSILSYAGKVSFGIAVDAALVPNAEEILSGFEAELLALEMLSRAPAERRSQSRLDADLR